METIIRWLEDHMLPCLYQKYLGMECPGCGMQRSFIELLKGNLLESFKLYPALLPVLFTLVLAASHLMFKFKKGPSLIVWSFSFSAAIIVINFVVKLITKG